MYCSATFCSLAVPFHEQIFDDCTQSIDIGHGVNIATCALKIKLLIKGQGNAVVHETLQRR